MNKKSLNAFLAALLVFLLAGCGNTSAKEVISTDPVAVIWTGSDFQVSPVERNVEIVQNIVDAQKSEGVTTINEAWICGDLTPVNSDEATRADSNLGAEAVLGLLSENWSLTAEQCLFTLGNHDVEGYDLAAEGGPYEREGYSVYVINEPDYPSKKSWVGDVKQTAETLSEWLNEKADIGYDRPIFIITHVPLHQSGRNDTRNGSFFVEVLNDAADRGLNIFYMFGHNHSDGYDDYLGGSCIYLEPGAEIPVAIPEGFAKEHYEMQEIKFTYFNTGYIGYAQTDEPESTTSSVVITIYQDCVELRRYNDSGLWNMKNIGTTEYIYDVGEMDGGAELLWQAYTERVESPAVVLLNTADK